MPPGPAPEGLENVEFRRFPLPGQLLLGAAEAGFLRLTPIQERLIPEVIAGHDVVALTKTGTGRTVAYLLPALARVKKAGALQVLVLAPTRTLAAQVAKDARKLAAHQPLVTVACLDGARKGSAEADDLAAGPTVVVGLPERIAEQVERGVLALDGVEVLVLDMADRMAPPGLSAAETVLVRTPQRRVTIVLAEEIPTALDAFLAKHVRDAIHVAPDGVDEPDQAFYAVAPESRLDALEAVVSQQRTARGVVLARDKFVADKVVERLKEVPEGVRAIHTGVPETKRARILKEFHAGRFTWLVATDDVAGDLAVERVRCVVNLEVPATPDAYARRLAWVAPMGKAGLVRTLVSPEQAGLLAALAPANGGKTPVPAALAGFESKGAAGAGRARSAKQPRSKDADRETWRPAWAGSQRHPGGKGG
jgi:superfamily II DNA/RNA helicase